MPDTLHLRAYICDDYTEYIGDGKGVPCLKSEADIKVLEEKGHQVSVRYDTGYGGTVFEDVIDGRNGSIHGGSI